MPASRRSWVRIRAYLISSLCATLAGLLSAAQDKGVTPLYGVSGELTVIAAVIIGGASILGGRGRVVGSCLGAMLVVLIDKVLREGWPITRIIKIGDEEIAVNAVYSLPVGAVPVFLGLLLVIAVLIEPYLIRRQVAGTVLGLAARPAAAARLRDRRRRARGRPDQGRDGDRHGAVGHRLRQVPRPPRRARHHPDRRCCG